MLPGLLVSPLAGAFLDRFGSARAIATDMLVSAALVLALAIADGAAERSASAAFLLTLSALFSLTSPLGAAGIRTLLPALVPEETRDRANALDTAIFATMEVLGPALAGTAVALLGSTPTLGVVSVRPTTINAVSSIYLTVTRASDANEAQLDIGFSA
jgi:MFS family permease